MQPIVAWWCQLLGITDPVAAQIALGVVTGGLLLAVAYLVVAVVVGLVNGAIRG